MQKKALNELKIQECYKKYIKRYNLNLPKLQGIKFVASENFWAEFNVIDLYNQKYILYVNTDLLTQNDKFQKQVLYHEFTHLADSIRFVDRTIEDYKNIMTSYSEFHASECEMIERLEEIEDANLTLQTEITHAGILTIDSFLQQSFDFMNSDLNKMANNNETFFFDVRHIYYFYGYVSALKKYNINYDIKTYSLAPDFLLYIENIQKVLLIEPINIDDIITTYLNLENIIKNKYLFNQVIRNLGNK